SASSTPSSWRPPRRRSATSSPRSSTHPSRRTAGCLPRSAAGSASATASFVSRSGSRSLRTSSRTSTPLLPASSARPRALVFNCHITGLAVARPLAAHGVEVVALDPDPRGLGQASKATVPRHACPNPLEDESGFADFLVARVGELGEGAVLFPTNDEWVMAVARHRSRLAECYRIPFSDLAVVDAVLDKRQLYAKAEALGIPIPRTFALDEPARTAREIRYPAIVKPA